MQDRTLKTILPGMPIKTRSEPRLRGAEAAWRTARAVAGVFSLAVSLVMLAGHLNASAIDPLKSPDLKELKEKLRLNPSGEPTKTGIRALDLELRARYFRQLSRSASGAYLLIGGVVVFLIAATQCARYRKQQPMPKPRSGATDPTNAAKVDRWAVSA